jgi:hypothetical protein
MSMKTSARDIWKKKSRVHLKYAEMSPLFKLQLLPCVRIVTCGPPEPLQRLLNDWAAMQLAGDLITYSVHFKLRGIGFVYKHLPTFAACLAEGKNIHGLNFLG